MSTTHYNSQPSEHCILPSLDGDHELDAADTSALDMEGPLTSLLRPVRDSTEPDTVLLIKEKQDLERFSSLDSPLQYPLISSSLQESLTKDFRSAKQLQKLLMNGFMLWLRTVVLLFLLGMTFWGYARKAVMSKEDKKGFNALVTGLSIALGLNIAASLNKMTLNMRWYFLSRKPWSLAEVDTILRSDVSNLNSYLINPKPLAASAAIFWLLVNIGSQIGVASLGLTYSIDNQVRAVMLKDGTIQMANLTSFFASNSEETPSIVAANYTANIFGNMALRYSGRGTIDKAPVPNTAYYSLNSSMWLGSDYWFYRFLSSSSADPSPPSSSSIYSERSINATWSCTARSVSLPSGNGSFTEITVNNVDGTGDTKNYTVPSVQPRTTTFYTSTVSCGPRCAQTFAFEASDKSPWFYRCNITLSTVANATLPEHAINDTMATTAAAAISLGGSSNKLPNTSRRHHYQRYPQESAYGQVFGGNKKRMGRNIAAFAIGAISVADSWNPMIQVPGKEPVPGLSLNIPELSYLFAIFSLVGGLQLILMVVTTFMANQVIVTDDSPFAIARLLSPIVARVGSAGTIAEGREICEVLEKEDKMTVIYSVHRYDTKGRKRRLVLGDEERERAMPNGRYE